MTKRFNPRFSRRSLLASLGAGMAATPLLPLFERETHAREAGVARVVLLFQANGTVRQNWLPTGTENDFTLSPILEPLESVREHLLILDGVSYRSGGAGTQHMNGPCKFTCGSGLLDGNEGQGNGNNEPTGGWSPSISLDQEHANAVSNQTAFASLEFGVGVQKSDNFHRMSYAGANMPLPPENDPAAMFDRIFGDFGLDTNELEELRAKRRSVLDVLAVQTESLKTRVASADLVKMEAHLDGIREIEKRLDLGGTGKHCSAPELEAPNNPLSTAAYPTVSELQLELLAKAFACDLTRSATVMWSGATSRQTFPWLGINDKHHGLSHAGNSNAGARQKLTDINRWYAQQFSTFVQALAAIPEGDGTVLDNTIVLWGNGLAEGKGHTIDRIPRVMAGGRNLGLDTGRFLTFGNGKVHNRVLVSILQALGHDTETFGTLDNGSGRINRMFVQ